MVKLPLNPSELNGTWLRGKGAWAMHPGTVPAALKTANPAGTERP